MSPKRLAARKRWILGDHKVKRNTNNHGAWLHARGYHLGDIRCSQCMKWINPENPFEAIEIFISPAGKRYHDKRYCLNPGMGTSTFTTTPHFSGGRRRRLLDVKRY